MNKTKAIKRVGTAVLARGVCVDHCPQEAIALALVARQGVPLNVRVLVMESHHEYSPQPA